MSFALPDQSPLPGSYDLVVCESCGCAFADSAARRSDYDAYYEAQSRYEDPRTATGGGDSQEDATRILELAVHLSADLAPSARILDIGCGNGGLLRALGRLGFGDLSGIDPSTTCVARVRSLGATGHRAVLPLTQADHARLGPVRFDLVVFSHVLEHVFDARAVVESVLPVLAEGGRVYIEVPDPARYSAPGFPPLYFFDAEHINHFSRPVLETLASQLGLVVSGSGTKDLALANGLKYPASYVYLTRGLPGDSGAARDDGLFGILSAYVERSLVGVRQVRDKIESLTGDARSVAIWGAGSLAQRLVAEPWFPVERLVAIVDRDSKKHGMRLVGRTIASPEDGLRDLPPESIVLCLAAIAHDQIRRDYHSMGYKYPFHSLSPSDRPDMGAGADMADGKTA